MSLDEIKQLPVPELARDDCVLLMWTTNQFIPKALEVIESWGFTYKTVAFAWTKQTKKGKMHFGMGQWTRSNLELCLLATKGRPKRKSKSVAQAILSPIREHSRKPDEAISRIEQLLDGPYVELFARKIAGNSQWRVWGDEARPIEGFWS